VIVTVDLEQLAELALAEAELHPPRTPGRRAAARLYFALTVPIARSAAAAERAIASFGTTRTQQAAAELLDRLTAPADATQNGRPQSFAGGRR
jgi:hypothetical protein